jgi:hypothetical protein
MPGVTALLPFDGDKVSEDALLVLTVLQTIGFTEPPITAVDDPRTDPRTDRCSRPGRGHGAALLPVTDRVDDPGERPWP